MAKTFSNVRRLKPCPVTGPARDGRGRGVGMSGGSRRGRRKVPQGRRRG